MQQLQFIIKATHPSLNKAKQVNIASVQERFCSGSTNWERGSNENVLSVLKSGDAAQTASKLLPLSFCGLPPNPHHSSIFIPSFPLTSSLTLHPSIPGCVCQSCWVLVSSQIFEMDKFSFLHQAHWSSPMGQMWFFYSKNRFKSLWWKILTNRTVG